MVFLHRDADSGKFLPMVMFGFKEGENLFLQGNRWQASYIPLMMRRGPFLIGFQGSAEDRKMVISVDLDDPRVGAEGESLFDPFGGNSEYTEQIIGILQQIDQGQAAIDEFSRSLELHDLIEPFSLDIRLDSGQHRAGAGGFQSARHSPCGLYGAGIHGEHSAPDRLEEPAWRMSVPTPEPDRPFRVDSPVEQVSGIVPDAIPDDLLASPQPLMLKGLVAEWPSVAQARERRAVFLQCGPQRVQF